MEHFEEQIKPENAQRILNQSYNELVNQYNDLKKAIDVLHEQRARIKERIDTIQNTNDTLFFYQRDGEGLKGHYRFKNPKAIRGILSIVEMDCLPIKNQLCVDFKNRVYTVEDVYNGNFVSLRPINP